MGQYSGPLVLSDQMGSSVRMKMFDSKVLEQFYPSVWMDITPGTSACRTEVAGIV